MAKPAIAPNTRDLGLAIRDALEGVEPFVYDDEGDTVCGKFTVDFIDVSDAHNPVLHCVTRDGANLIFTLHIVAGGR